MSEVKLISEMFVRPECETYDDDDSRIKKNYLGPAQLYWLQIGYSQSSILFKKPQNYSPSTYMEKLKLSLARTLTHFYPLAGQLQSERVYNNKNKGEDKNQNEVSYYIFVDHKKGPGAKLIYATALGLTISDITSPHKDVPLVVRSFFDLGETAVNYDGHTRPLLSVQVTELADGVSIGFSINHCIVDGTSAMSFYTMWSEMFMGSSTTTNISRNLILHNPHDLYGAMAKVPYLDQNLVKGVNVGNDASKLKLMDRTFEVSIKSMAILKAKVAERNVGISSFQALSALIWRSITRARNRTKEGGYKDETTTTCKLVMDLRSRLDPPLPQDGFGVVIATVGATTTVSELIANSLDWVAMMIHQTVSAINGNEANQSFTSTSSPPSSTLLVQMSGSAWMNKYGLDFGLGRPVAVQTGLGTKYDGKVFAFMGSEGPGSVELHFSLLPNTMSALLSDEEFLSLISLQEIK